MTDQPEAQQTVESADTQQTPMPSVSETPSEVAETSSQNEVSQTTQDEYTLPEGVKERTTEQFEKLKTDLRVEREKRQRAERVGLMYNQTPSSQQPIQQQSFYNPQTGEIDRVARAEFMASQAMQQAQRVIADNDRKQESEAYEAHPELNPNKEKTFNPKLHEAAVVYLAQAFAKGQSMTLKEAVDELKSFSKVDLKKAQSEGATKALEQLAPKEQAAMEATGRSDRRKQLNNLEDLRLRTRRGDKSAIIERLKNIPIIGK